MTIPLDRLLPDGSSCQPGSAGAEATPAGRSPPRDPYLALLPGGACRAATVASSAVGSYPTVSPLPVQRQAVCFLWRFPSDYSARALPGTVASGSPDFPPMVPETGARRRPSSPPRALRPKGWDRAGQRQIVWQGPESSAYRAHRLVQSSRA